MTGPREWSPRGDIPGDPHTIESFIQRNKITMTWVPIPNRPDKKFQSEGEQRWSDSAFHFKITLKRGTRRMQVYFSQGPANGSEPRLKSVLGSIASDVVGVTNNPTFLEWAQEYGFDPDSRQAEHMHRMIDLQAGQLEKFLGADLYSELLWKTELS